MRRNRDNILWIFSEIEDKAQLTIYLPNKCPILFNVVVLKLSQLADKLQFKWKIQAGIEKYWFLVDNKVFNKSEWAWEAGL